MSEFIYPTKVKYKGYTITQFEGKVIISNTHRHEILTIYTKRPHTREELKALFDFNARIYGLIKGGG